MQGLQKKLIVLLRAPKILSLILGMGLFMLLYLWFTFYGEVQQDKAKLLSEAYQDTARLSDIFKEHAERSLENADALTTLLQNTYQTNEQTAIDFLNTTPPHFLYRLYIFDADGSCLTQQDGLSKAFQAAAISDYLHAYRNAATTALIIGQDFWDNTHDSWTIPLMRRLTKPDGSFGGLAVMMTHSYYFSDLYNELDIQPDSILFLAGRDRYVRAAKSHSLVMPGKALHENLTILEYMESADHQTSILPSEAAHGANYIYSYSSLHNYPLFVAAGIPEASVLTRHQANVWHMLLVPMILSLGVIFFVLMLLRLLHQQLLSRAKLQAARDGLQDTVAQRTSELVGANAQLAQMNTSLENVNSQLEEEVAEHRAAEQKLRQADAELQRIAYYDAATHLPNRTFYHKWLTERLGTGNLTGGTIMSVDLDNLQTINDVFGHSYGDAVICEAARRIVDTAGKGAFVAHCGADEFSIVYPEITDEEIIEHKVQQLINEIRHVHRFNNISVHVTASIGVAIYPIHGACVEDLLKNVDNALSAAKQAGKNQWCVFSESLQAELYENVMLTAQLHKAIQREEFQLYYQPQIAAATGRVTGFEALIRWFSPELGFVSPAKFIPLAEKKGLIHEIGQWVARQTCDFAVRLQQMGFGHLVVAMNVSGHQFSRENFLNSLMQIVETSGVNPHQLELEITETALMQSLEGTVNKLEYLRSNGFRVSLDDFGTGYSSLNYLLRMPFDTLKIDKSFIDMIGQEEKGAQIVDAILMVAHILQKQVVAEGVETSYQLDYLRKVDCDIIQGFFFSKPLPEKDALAFLQKSIEEADAKNE